MFMISSSILADNPFFFETVKAHKFTTFYYDKVSLKLPLNLHGVIL